MLHYGTHIYFFFLDSNLYSKLRRKPLVSIIPQLCLFHYSVAAQALSALLCSSYVHSIASFELDDKYILHTAFNGETVLLPESINLTHLRITLFHFEHCVHLLNQLGSQLVSFEVNIVYVFVRDQNVATKMRTVNNVSYLKTLFNLFVLDFMSLFKTIDDDSLSLYIQLRILYCFYSTTLFQCRMFNIIIVYWHVGR